MLWEESLDVVQHADRRCVFLQLTQRFVASYKYFAYPDRFEDRSRAPMWLPIN